MYNIELTESAQNVTSSTKRMQAKYTAMEEMQLPWNSYCEREERRNSSWHFATGDSFIICTKVCMPEIMLLGFALNILCSKEFWLASDN